MHTASLIEDPELTMPRHLLDRYHESTNTREFPGITPTHLCVWKPHCQQEQCASRIDLRMRA